MITKWLSEGRATKEALIKAIRGMKLHSIADKYSGIECQIKSHVSVGFGMLVDFS